MQMHSKKIKRILKFTKEFQDSFFYRLPHIDKLRKQQKQSKGKSVKMVTQVLKKEAGNMLPRPVRTMHRRGILRIALVLVTALILLCVRLGDLMLAKSEHYKELAYDLHTRERQLKAMRGEIQDRNGKVLAANRTVCTISVIHSQIKDADEVVSALSETLKMQPKDVQKKVEKITAREIIKTNVEKKVGDAIREMDLAGVKVDEDYKRYYPFGSLASKVLGFTGADNQGIIGLEVSYDEVLKGIGGSILTYTDAAGIELKNTAEQRVEPIAGNTLRLTMDWNIQSFVTQVCLELMEEKQANEVSCIVMNPQNGEIYAMANVPEFDLNRPFELPEGTTCESEEIRQDLLNKMWRNANVSDTYEPGSTFKPVTVASALEEGVVKDGDTYVCKGFETVADYKLKCHVFSTIGSHGSLTVEQALMNSCNPYMIHLALEMGNSRFAYYQSLFGFGKITGIDLPGETTGIVYGDRMTTIDAACNSFGQTINVNMMQMMAAYCSIINGGMLYQPHIVKRIESANGEVVKEYKANLVRQTITASTSKLLRRYLKNTVEEGTAKKAGVTGYSVAGKTGTAQKGDRKDNKWIISFIGHAPAENPKFAIYVVIDEPYGTTGTSGSSADVLTLTHNILEKLLPYMNVYKDASDEYEDTSSSPDELTVDGIPAGTASSN